MNPLVQNSSVKTVQNNCKIYTYFATLKLHFSGTPKQITVYCKLAG